MIVFGVYDMWRLYHYILEIIDVFIHLKRAYPSSFSQTADEACIRLEHTIEL